MTQKVTPRIAIVGAGLSGVAQAVKLKRAGIETFTVFERNHAVGGVWHENTYPGAEVDTPSHWYSFSFRHNDWVRTHSTQPELEAYISDTVDAEGVRSHFRFGTVVKRVVWDEARQGYEVVLGDGRAEHFDVVVSAVGLFNVPKYPDWLGLEDFQGACFHSARWEHEHDLTGKRVAVVGTGSTGTQIAVALAPIVEHLYVFQRTPGWLTAKGERVLTDEERARLRRPASYKRERWKSFWQEQKRFWGGKQMQPGTKKNDEAHDFSVNYIATVFKDRPDLAKAVTPDYPFFGKRPVRATGFYEVLLRDNVTFVPRAVQRVTPTGIVDTDGTERQIDAIVMATGFQPAEYLAELDLRGRGGVSIHDVWRGEPEAFVGLQVPGFPNFYMLYGPNTNMGTILFNLETQADYVVSDVKRMIRTGATSVEVRPVAHRVYNRWLQARLRKTVWAQTDSYYKSTSGKVVVPFPTAMIVYWALCRLLRRVATVGRGRPVVHSPASATESAAQSSAVAIEFDAP